MHIAEENHLSDFQVHFLKAHAQCGKREVFLEFFNRAEEDDLVFHDLDHISTFKNSMLDEFCKLFGHLGFSSGALPSSTLLKGIIESLQKGCSPAVSRDRIAVWIQKLLSSFMWQCYLKYRDDAPPSHSRHSSASSTDDSSDPPTSPHGGTIFLPRPTSAADLGQPRPTLTDPGRRLCRGRRLPNSAVEVLLHETSGSYVDLQLGCRCFDYHAPPISGADFSWMGRT
ncbi:hypothetical protein PAPYR_12562 [Paratrimastix pyriformis]|uniref:Uncharacterized protein n=1 Tax=Paratrimastix pyriformis TaxID=342808 RepID=A0ABQ8U6X1_9EUKA|nr:hypothetical protein PAPYR_12562 [Paratrimastix pyriformis]